MAVIREGERGARRSVRLARIVRLLVFAFGVGAALLPTGCREKSRGDDGVRIGWNLGLPLTEDERRYIRELPTLRVGFDAQWPPMAFADGAGRLDGISGDYLAFVLHTLGVRMRLVPTRTWAEAIARANRGEFDIVVAASKFDTLKPGFVLTAPYVRYPLVIVTRESAPFISGPADLAGTDVALVDEGDVGRMPWRYASSIRPFVVASAQAGLDAVEDGRAFAYIGNLAVVDRLVRGNHAGNLRVAAPVGAEQALSFALAPGYERLASLIDRTLQAIPEAEREHIQNSWLTTRLTFGVPKRTLWLVLTPVVSLTVVFVLVLSVNLRRLRNEVRQRRWTEAALRFETRFKTNLLNTIPIPVFVKDMDGTYLAVNPAYEAAMGVSAARVVGKQMAAVGHVRREDLDTLAGITARVIESGDPAHGEVRYQGPDGATHDAIYWVRACRDADDAPSAVLGAFVDVSDLRRMERRELELKQQLVALTQALPAVVFQLRYRVAHAPRFELVFVNEQAYTWLQMHQGARSDPFAAFLRSLGMPGRFKLARLFLRSARTLDAVRADFELVHGARRSAWMHLEAAPRLQEDSAVVWSGSLNDVTQVKANQAALLDAKHEAQAATRARDAFLATVSHEIRTPMSGVVGILQLLDHGKLSPDDQHLVNMALNAAQILLRILNDILDFARSAHQALPLEPAAFNVADAIERCAGIMAPEFARKQLRFEVDIGPELRARHVGDAQRLGQVLLNLLGNAAKFTERGGVSIHAVGMSDAVGMTRIVIRVVDTGVGIPFDDQARLFSPFMQASGNSPARHGGTGLGLAICKRIVESMRGSIALESSPGNGTTVTVSVVLPVVAQVAQVAPVAPTDEAAPGMRAQVCTDRAEAPTATREPALGAVRVLVVEDDDVNREVLRRQLSRLGVGRCDLARNGREALALTARQTYDMIITDLSMPEMNGIELVGHIRAAERGQPQRTVVIVLTANAMAQQTRACVEAGADALCLKPLALDALRRLFAQHGLASAEADGDGRNVAPMEQHSDLLAQLRATLSEDMRALDARLRDDDFEAVHTVAHRMSGCASWFQLADIAEAAAAIERALDADLPFDRALDALREAVARANASVANG